MARSSTRNCLRWISAKIVLPSRDSNTTAAASGTRVSSAVNDRFRQRPTGFPAGLFEGRGVAFLHGIADAEIADERPFQRYVQDLGYPRRLQYGKPADANSFGARGKPKRVNG